VTRRNAIISLIVNGASSNGGYVEKGGVDDCARAANIYQCGREKAPNVTKAMQDAAASKIYPVSFSWAFSTFDCKLI
jgi:hypothetical protein